MLFDDGVGLNFCAHQHQSIKSARLYVQSSELGPPTPSPRKPSECCSPPFWVQVGRHTRFRGVGTQF
jgi:hypothetical protein